MHNLTLEVVFEYTDTRGNHVVLAHYLDKILKITIAGYTMIEEVEIIGIKTMADKPK